jgi:hypothetical protein
MFSSVACLAVPYFSTLSHKSQDFKEKKFWNIICVFIFSQLLSEILFIKSRIQRGIIINVYTSSCKLPDFNKTSIFLRGSVYMLLLTTVNNLLTWRWPNTAETCRHRRCNKLRYYSNTKFHDSPSSGSRVVPCGKRDRQTARQTDTNDEANSCFSQFCERA